MRSLLAVLSLSIQQLSLFSIPWQTLTFPLVLHQLSTIFISFIGWVSDFEYCSSKCIDLVKLRLAWAIGNPLNLNQFAWKIDKIEASLGERETRSVYMTERAIQKTLLLHGIYFSCHRKTNDVIELSRKKAKWLQKLYRLSEHVIKAKRDFCTVLILAVTERPVTS